MCKHLKNSKLTFKQYYKKKLNNEMIYYYCEKCDKFFVEKQKTELNINSWIFIYIFLSLVNLFKKIFNLGIETLLFVVFLLMFDIAQKFLRWKFLKFVELRKDTGKEEINKEDGSPKKTQRDGSLS